MRTRNLSIFITLFFLILSVGYVSAQPTISSFTPSGGWPGTDFFDGTKVEILGTGFDADPGANYVFFTRTAGGMVSAHVHASFPDDTLYSFQRTIGQPGNLPGELRGPWGIAVDKNLNIYVASNQYNVDDNQFPRVEVFDYNGNATSQLGQGLIDSCIDVTYDIVQDRVFICGQKVIGGTMQGYVLCLKTDGSTIASFSIADKTPQWIAVNGNDVYLTFQEGGPARKYDLTSGNMLKELQGSSFSIPIGPLAFHEDTKTLYVGDPLHNLILTYKNDALQNEYSVTSVHAIAVDWKGFVYVSPQWGEKLFKYDTKMNLVAEISTPSSNNSFPISVAIAVDKNLKIYAVERDPDIVKAYSPNSTNKLIVTVPPSAATGPIRVGINGDSSSENDFTVFQVSEVQLVEGPAVTQGVSTYPFVAGKETYVYARFKGLFGAPGRDRASVCVNPPHICVYGYGGGNCEFEFTKNHTETLVYYHVPRSFIDNPDTYHFLVELSRDDKSFNYPDDWFRFQKNLSQTDELNLLFVKLTNKPREEWNQVNPFSWFDTKRFLDSLETLKRTFPIKGARLNIEITEAESTSNILYNIMSGLEVADLSKQLRDIKKSYEFDYSAFVPDIVIGLINKDYRTQNIPRGGKNGNTIYLYFPYAKDQGTLLSHEVGHAFDLVPSSQSNYSGDDSHSINLTLKNEFGAPVTTWNALTDELRSGDNSYSIMSENSSQYSLMSDVNSFFESLDKDEKELDYPYLFKGLGGTKTSASTNSLSSYAASVPLAAQRFVIIGSIHPDDQVEITNSFLTTSAMPFTDIAASDYALVFLDENGQVLYSNAFPVLFYLQDLGPSDIGIFEVVSPYPADTAAVEIRYRDHVLETLAPSASPPVVSNVTVETPEFLPIQISWLASDPDGDALIYSVLYSANGGETFTPLAVGLTDTDFLWHENLSVAHGSANGVIRVTANDGFYLGSADSAAFILPKKMPLVEILRPSDGATFTQGSAIRLRGAGFDPEDGSLSGDSLMWLLDDSIDIGTGATAAVQLLPIDIAYGTILMPLAVGDHTIRLTGTDSDDNAVSDEITVTVVADTDRDGFSDQDESDYYGDPYDPFYRPDDLDADDDGLLVTTEDTNRDGVVDQGETDPDVYDTDGDGLPDGLESGLQEPESEDTDREAGYFAPDFDPDTTTDPTNPDTDMDSLLDGEEDVNRNGAVDNGETDPNNPDTDGDTVPDGVDNCQQTVPGAVVDAEGCSIDQLCPCSDPWKNHGAYVECIARTSETFMDQGLITEAEKDMIVMDAAESTCGSKK